MNWKPIASAPRDGRWVLCRGDGWEYPVILFWLQRQQISQGMRPYSANFEHRWDDRSGDNLQNYEPTEWFVAGEEAGLDELPRYDSEM